MTNTLLQPKPLVSESPETERPNASILEERLPDHLRAPKCLVGYIFVCGLVYLFLNYRLLWHTDLWGHLAYGRLMWEGGALPQTEPLMPLATGVPFVDTAWLSQLIGFGAFRAFGVTALSFLYASIITLCVAMLLWRFHKRTQSVLVTLAGLGVFAWVDWQQLMIIRPQLAGFLCFASLLTLMTAKRWSGANWVVIPTLFALWANLHGSFPVGLAMLCCFWFGRMFDVLRRTRNFKAVALDDRVRRYFLLTELAAAAVLLNPYGIAIYAEVLCFSNSPNLADLVEWSPLNLRMSQGQAAAAVVLALMAAYRFSPRRVSATEVLLLVGLGICALWTSRMILWWAPVAAYYLVLHGGSTWRRYQKDRMESEPSPRAGRWSMVAVALVWIFFGLTPFASRVLHGREVELKKIVSQYTPVAAVEHLKKDRPLGQIFNVYEWGDYLLWSGPKDIQVFVASHAHLVPTKVWEDYLRVINNSAGWEDILERYGVNTVIIDYRYRSGFIRRLKRNDDWRLTFDDGDRAAIFVRKEPILTGGNPAEPPETQKAEA